MSEICPICGKHENVLVKPNNCFLPEVGPHVRALPCDRPCCRGTKSRIISVPAKDAIRGYTTDNIELM